MEGKTTTDALPVDIENMINKAFEVMAHSYSPYSHFPVGAAVLCQDGSIYAGCNVENTSYPVGVCAEKGAVCKAVSDGKRDFKAIAIASTMTDKVISPCGTCRQFLVEFGVEYDVYMLRADRYYKRMRVGDLLPLCFTPKDLEDTVS